MSAVHEAMAAVMKEVTAIAKVRSENVSYAFRSIDSVLNALHGPLADNGLFLAPRVLDDWQLNAIPGTNNRIQYQTVFRVEVVIWHSSGDSVVLGPGLAQSHDYGDKAAYQSQQNAIKYLLLEAFAVPTAESDMDSRQADDSPVPEPVDLSDLIRTKVAIFSKWSEDERRDVWKAHAEKTLGGRAQTPGEVAKVVASMHEQYLEQYPPTAAEAPF